MKTTRRFVLHTLLISLSLVVSHAGNVKSSFALPDTQSDCIGEILGDDELITSQSLDVDQDGALDRVVLYIKGDVNRGEDPIYILALSESSGDCEVILDEYLIWSALTTGRQEINVRAIEMVELTGDDQQELHVWLEKSGGGAHETVAFHAILATIDGEWKHVLGNVGVTQCLAFSSFEFRDAPTGNAKDIYLDEDRHCEPPWSSSRTYTIVRWNGSRFMPAESGTIDVRTTNPPWIDVFCAGVLIGPVALVALVALASALVFAVARKRAQTARGRKCW
jgi:hypothetical protein